VFQIKVTLLDVEPPVWRQLLISADTNLARLHAVLNEAVGWQNSHLHEFRLRDRTFGGPRIDDEGDVEDERRFKVNQLLSVGQSIEYAYDLGDGWTHAVMVEKLLDLDPCIHYPLCVAGARSCPPEDCGGVGGSENLLAALADPNHEEHDELTTWVGGTFDPAGFDLNRVNRALRESG
jgi:hypothetical protein